MTYIDPFMTRQTGGKKTTRLHNGSLKVRDTKGREESSSEADDSRDQRSRQLSLRLWYYDVLLCLSGCGLAGARL